MVTGKGTDQGYLSKYEIREIVQDGLSSLVVDGKRVLVIIPDTTRTMPMPLMFELLNGALQCRVQQLDYLVALGTHPPLDDAKLSSLVGKAVIHGRVGDINVHNHEWGQAGTFCEIGTIPAAEISQISSGWLSQDVPVRLNKLIYEYDQLIICGPVFPHEVVGFSGGNKYLFPGIAGAEIINLTHWLGALITSSQVIGRISTPVRSVIDRAAQLVSLPTACFSLVVDRQGVAGLYFGEPIKAWLAAARLSEKRHIIYTDRPYQRVLSVMPEMYQDLWTAAKGMYKLERVVADGGELIIYAPHLHEVSFTYGALLDEIGYHCRDYYLTQWERFKRYPGGVLAHSTHLAGLGQYDVHSGREIRRIRVTLAAGIPAERCRRLNLGYLDPASIKISAWTDREEQGILVVPQAGEVLYRLKDDLDQGVGSDYTDKHEIGE
jgi:nickel-dependent lactate racemase